MEHFLIELIKTKQFLTTISKYNEVIFFIFHVFFITCFSTLLNLKLTFVYLQI